MALLSVVFPGVGSAATDGGHAAKPAAKPSAILKAVKPAVQMSKQSQSAAQSPLKKGTCKAPSCKERRTGAMAIKQALAEKTCLEFRDTPLCDVVEYLKDQHHIEIQLDKKAMDDVGVAPDVPITRSVKGVSLRSGLKLLLDDLGLTFEIRSEVLMITTPEKAEAHLTTVVYDVADLVTCRDEKGELWEDYDQLIETITSTIKPTTWDSVGGPGSIAPGTFNSAKVLVISQTDDIHEEIDSLLENIRDVIKQSGGKSEPPRRIWADRPQCGSVMGGMGSAAKPPQSGSCPSGGHSPTPGSHAGGTR
jgi:hypothetical protein